MDNRIIVIDDEQDFLDSVKRGLIMSGFRHAQMEIDPRKGAARFAQGEVFDIALIDVTMPFINGVGLLELIKKTSPNTECIMVTGKNDAKVAVQSMKKGAYDYLIKPISRDELVLTISRALERKRLLDILDLEKKRTLPKLIHAEAFRPIVTRSDKLLRVLREAELHSLSDVPVLITGETGTGKELLARAIHAASPRAKFPFIPINMASVTGNLFDAEFFGHTKGAFTGAEKDRMGYIEHTNKGTLFLDEIGSLPPELQGKLLRLLQEGEYIKLGTSMSQKADVRFIAATNADLERLMAKGMFRKDLYYRLKGAWLHLPPLRERTEDIPLLLTTFLEKFGGVNVSTGIDEQAASILSNYDYPGNIRELRSILQSAVNLAQGKPISTRFLPNYLQKRKAISMRDSQPISKPVAAFSEVEKEHILKVYNQMGRNKSQTARVLGIGLNTLRRKLRAYGLE
jgi:DNA-binding NtrC family response regulator